MIRPLNILLLLLFATTPLWANDVNTFAEAKAMATKVNRPILIDFWSDN